MRHVLPPRGALWSRVVAHPGLEGGGPLVPDSMYRLDIPSQRPLPPGTKGVVSTSARAMVVVVVGACGARRFVHGSSSMVVPV